LSEGRTPQLQRGVRLADVEQFRAHGVVGSGFLRALRDGVWIDVVRYSNTLATRFARLAAKLETLRETGEFRIFEEDEVDERRCLKCGLALSFAGDVCPRCINRGAVLGRVWGLLKPYRRAAAVMCVLIVLGVVAELAPPKLQQYL